MLSLAAFMGLACVMMAFGFTAHILRQLGASDLVQIIMIVAGFGLIAAILGAFLA